MTKAIWLRVGLASVYDAFTAVSLATPSLSVSPFDHWSGGAEGWRSGGVEKWRGGKVEGRRGEGVEMGWKGGGREWDTG